MPVPNPDAPLKLSETAVAEIHRFCGQRGDTARVVVTVQPGGCLGHRYSLDFDQKPSPHYQCWPWDGVELWVDPAAIRFLNGSTLDYAEDLMGGSFRFHNPPQASLCPCGLSFGVSSDQR